MNQEKMGKLISKIRKEKGLTQEQLGQQLGVSSKAVSKWECGLTTPDISIVNDLAEILGITTKELLNGREILKKKKILSEIKRAIFKNKILSIILFGFVIVFILLLLFFFNNYNKYEVISFYINENKEDSNIYADGYIFISPNENYVALNKLNYFPMKEDIMINSLSISIENDSKIIFNYNLEETIDDNGRVKTFYLNEFLDSFSYISKEGKKREKLKVKDLNLILSYNTSSEKEKIIKNFVLNFNTDSASNFILK